MDKGFKQRFLSPKNYYLFTFFIWFCRTRLFDYMSMGFILLDYESTIRFWKSVYFIGHVFCVVFIVLGYVLCKLFPKPKSKKEEWFFSFFWFDFVNENLVLFSNKFFINDNILCFFILFSFSLFGFFAVRLNGLVTELFLQIVWN